ncbi:putative MFS family arabinose efflux permease [Nitrobacteraceae bacterium AZCC 1564]
MSKSRAGSAVAAMMGGLTIAMVIGVPLGSWIGQLFDWRTPFLIVTALTIIAVLGLVWLLPRDITYQQPAPFLAQLGLLGNRSLAILYLLTAVGFGSTFVVFTFISPLLTNITGVPKGTVNIALLIFGAASFVGNFAGGRLSDLLGTRKAMMIVLCGLIVSFAFIPLAIHHHISIFVIIAIWGVFAFAIPPIMQTGVVATAEQVAPDAIGTASGFNIAAFNLGISAGSYIGGQLLQGPGLLTTPYASIAMAIIVLVITTFALRPQTAPAK